MFDREYIENVLNSSDAFLEGVGLATKDGVHNRVKRKKLAEIVGFCLHLFSVIGKIKRKDRLVFLECSCGKSYLSFAVNLLFSDCFKGTQPSFIGIDRNGGLIDKCREVSFALGFSNMEFIESATIDYEPADAGDRRVDVVIALHACGAATDEAIAKGIETNARFIVVVPCCQNQMKGMIKSGHPLTALTEFGLLRYRFANILTDALRAQFLRGSGYSVQVKEITTIRYTPKNLIIIASKKKSVEGRSFRPFEELRKVFDVDVTLRNHFPEMVSGIQ